MNIPDGHPWNDHARQRRRSAFAIAAWSALPAIAAVSALNSRTWWAAVSLGTIVLIAVIAASLASGSTERQHVAAAGLLLLIAMPFGARLLQRLVLEPPSHAAAIADSPLGYVIGTIGDALFFVPPVVFAFAVWKRRGALQPTLPDHANH